MADKLIGKKLWPRYFFKSDTTGEKDFEEFFTDKEDLNMKRFDTVGIIKNVPEFDEVKLDEFTCGTQSLRANGTWTKDEIVKLFDEFILVKLYTDGREEKHKRYRDLEIDRFKTAALPYYVVLNGNNKEILTFPGYNTNAELFKNFLQNSINIFNNQ